LADERELPHIVVENSATTEAYRYPGGGGSEKPLPPHDRQAHASRLLSALDRVRSQVASRKEELKAWAVPAKKGVHVEFESEPGFELELGSLEDRHQGIQVVAIRRSPEKEDTQLAVVHVPEGKLKAFERKIEEYATRDTAKGKPRHRKLVEKIADIRLATLRSFWTDRDDLLPTQNEAIWWEVWLRSPDEKLLDDFRFTLGQLEIEIGDRSLEFPSTRVLLAYGTLRQFSASVEAVDAIAELRRAKEVPSLFMEMPRLEQRAWVDELLQRLEPPPDGAPRICVLDTGVNAGHPLLEVALEPEDLHAVDPSWGVQDHDGHGTGMAGLALYGDLREPLVGSDATHLPAWLESVKILPPPPDSNDPELYGSITEQAVHRVEVQRPRALRTHVMTVTTVDFRDAGRPSSWSAAVDKLAYGEEGEPERLLVLSAGNSEPEVWADHPEHLETEEIHDPAQAWNALTVGAFTDRWQVSEADFDGWTPVAQPGDLSPCTSTSFSWETRWPLKPDVVAEGGNAARAPDGGQIDLPDSLQLLTTYREPLVRLLTPFGGTSGASALVAHMAAHLRRQYPELWPETIRALIVHSARWTGAMHERYRPSDSKGGYERLVRHCGFGVPSLDRALWSARNRLTLIAQESSQPFSREQGRAYCSLKELQIFKFPWPIEQLQELGDVEVELRVTLSYFIEPNPSERGYKYRHRYASHGYRFDVRAATESLDEFRKRLNKAARDEEEQSPGTSGPSEWLVGSNARHRGSIHSDIWRGPAAELADRQHLAVYPVSGWWKERYYMDRWRREARYALVVSIHAPEIEVDLYTPVRTQIGIPIAI
jgi:Subtilase family